MTHAIAITRRLNAVAAVLDELDPRGEPYTCGEASYALCFGIVFYDSWTNDAGDEILAVRYEGETRLVRPRARLQRRKACIAA